MDGIMRYSMISLHARMYQFLFDELPHALTRSMLSRVNARGLFTRLFHGLILSIYIQTLSKTMREKRDALDGLLSLRYQKLRRNAATSAYWQRVLPQGPEETASIEIRMSDVACVSRDELKDIPATDLITTRGKDNETSFMWRRTSGTTGKPFQWGCDLRTFYVSFPAFYFRMIREYGLRWNPFAKKSMCILNFHDVERHPLYPFSVDLQWSPNGPDSEKQIERIVQTLSSLNAPILFTYPTDLWLLAQELEKRHVRPAISCITTIGQMLEDKIREAAERYFACPVRSFYTSREFFALGMECPRHLGFFHVNEEHVIIETVDEQGQRIPEGEWGDIAITGLDNLSMPLIRYRIGDVGRLLGRECSCGITLPLMELKGRPTEFITSPDGTYMTAHEIGAFILDRLFTRVRQYQIREEVGGLRILIIPQDVALTHSEETEFKRAVRKMTGNVFSITVEHVNEIPKVGGKFARFVPKKIAATHPIQASATNL